MNNFRVNVGDFIFCNEKGLKEMYRIGKSIGGEGSYGQLRFCIHKRTGCLRAVKMIDKNNLDMNLGNQTEKEIQNTNTCSEIEILCEVDHPGIMRIFEWFSDKNRFYIISDLY